MRHARHLTTAHDEPVRAGFPLALHRGTDPVLVVTEGFHRGQAVPGRCADGRNLLALRIGAGDRALQVRLRLSLDRTATDWRMRTTPLLNSPRVLLVRAQHRLRAAAVLCDLPEPVTGAWIRFDLDAGEVPPDGLLLLELTGEAAGLALAEIVVETPRPAPTGSLTIPKAARAGLLSCGGLAVGAPVAEHVKHPLLVVNPRPVPLRLTFDSGWSRPSVQAVTLPEREPLPCKTGRGTVKIPASATPILVTLPEESPLRTAEPLTP